VTDPGGFSRGSIPAGRRPGRTLPLVTVIRAYEAPLISAR